MRQKLGALATLGFCLLMVLIPAAEIRSDLAYIGYLGKTKPGWDPIIAEQADRLIQSHRGNIQTALLVIGFWGLGAVISLASAIHFHRRHRAEERTRRGLCPSCGYDIRATPGRCPECGAVPAEAAR